MSTLQKLQCDQCGGRIDRASLTCQSCGMQYRYEHETQELRIITETRRTDVLSGAVRIPNEILIQVPEKGIEWAIKELANNMARRLVPYMEWEYSREPEFNQTAVYGRVRVAIPMRNGISEAEEIIREATEDRK